MQDKERYDLLLNGGRLRATKKEDDSPAGRRSPAWYYYLGFVGHIGLTIAVPMVSGALLGGYIDRVWSTYPKGTLSFLLLGIVLGTVGFIQTLNDLVKNK